MIHSEVSARAFGHLTPILPGLGFARFLEAGAIIRLMPDMVTEVTLAREWIIIC